MLPVGEDYHETMGFQPPRLAGLERGTSGASWPGKQVDRTHHFQPLFRVMIKGPPQTRDIATPCWMYPQYKVVK